MQVHSNMFLEEVFNLSKNTEIKQDFQDKSLTRASGSCDQKLITYRFVMHSEMKIFVPNDESKLDGGILLGFILVIGHKTNLL